MIGNNHFVNKFVEKYETVYNSVSGEPHINCDLIIIVNEKNICTVEYDDHTWFYVRQLLTVKY